MDATAWHDRGDASIDDALVTLGRILDDPDVATRVSSVVGEELLLQAHLLSFRARFTRSERFRVVDVGCGDGRYLARLLDEFPNAIGLGIDSNERSIELANRRDLGPNAEFVQQRFEDLPTRTFDAVLCAEVFEHVEEPDALLRLCHGLLADGGLFAFSTPSGWMMRSPRLATAGLAVVRPREYLLRRYPERSWSEALPMHPGSRWRVLRRQLEDAGFSSIERSSSMFVWEPGWPSSLSVLRRLVGRPGDSSWLLGIARSGGRRGPHRTARRFFHLYVLMEALMNLVPPLRLFEGRIVVTATRQPSP